MALDHVANFAKGEVFTGYDAASTTLELVSGHGARFPAAPFNATWWNATDYADPFDDPDKEIIRVESFSSSDVMNITRAQEFTSATDKNIAGKTYMLIAGITAKMIDDIETGKANAAHEHSGGIAFTLHRSTGLQVGDKVKCVVPFSGTILSWTIATIDESTATVKLNTAKVSEGGVPSFVDIDGVNPIELSAHSINVQGIPGWLDTVDAGDHFEISVEEVTGTVTGVYGIIYMTKTT